METTVGVMVEEAAMAVEVMVEAAVEVMVEATVEVMVEATVEEAAMAVAMAAGAGEVEGVERVEMAERAVVMVETARPQHFLPS